MADDSPSQKPKSVTDHLRVILQEKSPLPLEIQIGGRSKALIELDIRDMAIDYTGRDIEIKREKEGD